MYIYGDKLPKLLLGRIQKYWDRIMPADYPYSSSEFSLKFDTDEIKAAVEKFENELETERLDKYKVYWPGPNKNHIFKKISFEIIDHDKDINIDSIKSYTSKSCANFVAYYVERAKEKHINQFISANGGIDIDQYMLSLKELFRN